MSETTRGDEHLAFWMKRLVEPRFVYVIQGEPGTAIKVGLNMGDVNGRIAQLQTGNPAILRLLEVVPGDRRLEWNFHERLAPSRVHGEWFHGPDVSPFMDYLALLSRAMVASYDGSGRPPRYSDFDHFREPPEPSPREDRQRRARKPRSTARRRLAPQPVEPGEAPPPRTASPEEQALWSRVAQMWIGGATRKEIRGAEGLSQDQLRRVIAKMRANGYELPEGMELVRGENEDDRGPGKFRKLGSRHRYGRAFSRR
jgi:Meiotically up-regulated gene 113